MKSLIKILFVFCLLLIINCSSFQAQSVTWQRTYNFYPYYLDDEATCVCAASDGNYIVSGYGGFQGGITIKINPFGDTLWTAKTSFASAYSIAASNDGGCVFTGEGDSGKAFTVKISGNGNVVWNKSYGGSGVRLFSIIRTADSGYVVCGRDWRTNVDGLIIKLDSTGNLIWQKYFLAGFDKTLLSIVETQEKNLLVTGVDEPTFGGEDPGKTLVMKLNQTGDSIWVKRYNINSTSSYGQKIIISSQGYIIAGPTGDSIGTSYQWQYFIKIDTSGNLLYKKIHIAARNEYYLDFAISNNRYILSTSSIINSLHISGNVYEMDPLGTIIRQKVFNDTGRVGLNSILPLSNGDLLFAGYSMFDYVTKDDFCIVRTDSLLNSPPIGIHNTLSQIPSNFYLYQNFPNPFNPATKIKFDLPKDELVSVNVYDILGKVVFTISKFKKAGTYEVNFDGTNLASGLYFYKLEAGSFVEKKKMVLLK